MNQELYRFFILDKKHHEWRKPCTDNLGEEYSSKKYLPEERMVDRFERMTRLEVPHIQPFEKIVMLRTVSKVPDCFTEGEWAKIRSKHFVHELGYISNLSPDYAKTIAVGLLERRREASPTQRRVIDALIDLSDRYLAEAKKQGREDLVEVFERVPRYGARNFREALQFFRILHYALWLEGDYHNTVGRFDQYMYPYFKKDLDAGVYTKETALDLLEDFFISFNKDSDLYVGVQQGDNGQSMVLGGIDAEGNDCFNELSELCLYASRNLKLIDPKINLRVSKNTPIEQFELGTQLTKVGLGFPQYCNDDVVIPGLERLGYSHEDACNYVVAACWEFIIPGVGRDIGNIAAVNFPAVIDRSIRRYLPESVDFDGLLRVVREEIHSECASIRNRIHDIWFVPSPLMELLLDETKYQNFGIHGSGIAGAADALAAVKKFVFDEKRVTPIRLLNALDSDYKDDPELLHLLRYEAPKMGCDNDEADDMSRLITDTFADALENKKNCLGGVWRAGTGTAMYYLWHTRDLGATADGRRKGEPYGTNFSPNLFAQTTDPISVVRSFSKQNLQRCINGGPLTLEFACGIFNNDEAIHKVALLLQYFVQRGGHQLQLNTVNPDAMHDAQLHPDLYRQLVVRIWGWSAYFVELDRDFQDHVIARQEYVV